MKGAPHEEAEHYREIADKIRALAREAQIAEIEEDLSNLARQFERMADLAEKNLRGTND
jgi:predicted MarR family transcription regulator